MTYAYAFLRTMAYAFLRTQSKMHIQRCIVKDASPEAHSEPNQRSKMDLFAKIVSGFLFSEKAPS